MRRFIWLLIPVLLLPFWLFRPTPLEPVQRREGHPDVLLDSLVYIEREKGLRRFEIRALTYREEQGRTYLDQLERARIYQDGEPKWDFFSPYGIYEPSQKILRMEGGVQGVEGEEPFLETQAIEVDLQQETFKLTGRSRVDYQGTTIHADDVSGSLPQEILWAQGELEVQTQAGAFLRGGELTYYMQDKRLVVQGPVVIQIPIGQKEGER